MRDERDPSRGPCQAGTSIIQLLIGITILGLIYIGFVGTADQTRRFAVLQGEKEALARQGVQALDRVKAIIRGSDGESFIADPFGTTALPDGSVTEIQIRRVTGVDEDWKAVRSDVTRVLWRPMPGETIDQEDNNGNGLVDEGVLAAIRADGSEMVLANHVPEQGLRIRDTGDGFVTVSLTVQRPRVVAGHPPRARTFSARVPLR